jgi:hypothetical protein
MREATNKQESSSKEGGEVNYKTGDKVWVLCEVLEPEHQGSVACQNHNYVLHPYVDEIRPVETDSSEIPDSSSDPINPSHYKQGGMECIEAIKAALSDGFPDYLRGNAMKYLWRYKEKGGVDDLKKARWYLDRLIKEVGE